MRGRVCLITGANAGIGFVTARDLAGYGATVVLLCRDRGRGEAARQRIRRETGNEDLHLLLCDLASQASVRDAAAAFHARFERLHVLINNAAAYTEERTVTEDGFETQFAVNYLSAFLLTSLLLDTLKSSAPSRIVNVSTVNHFHVSLHLDDLQSERGFEAKAVHMRSKLALILFTYELARRLDGTNVSANCLHPGVVATRLLAQVRRVAPDRDLSATGGAPLEEGARTVVYLATSAQVAGTSGQYYEDCRPVPSSDETHDREKARRLWEISEALTAPSPGS